MRALARATATLCLIAIAGLGFILRAGPVVDAPETRRGGMGPYADPELYHQIARNLVRGNGFESGSSADPSKRVPVIFRGPGYPLYLAAFYAAHGVGAEEPSADEWLRIRDSIRLAQCAMDASISIALYLILLAAFPGKWLLGLLGAALQALNPYSIHYARALLTEPLAAFLAAWCLALLALAMRARMRGAPAAAFVPAGILGALLCLARPEYMPWLAAVSAFLAFFPRAAKGGARLGIGSRLMQAAAFLLVPCALIGLWTARNAAAFGKPILVASGSMGELLHRGSFEGSYPWKGWAYYPPELLASKEEGKELARLYEAYFKAQASGGKEALDVDAAFMALALERIKADPAAAVKAWLRNIPRLWYQNYTQLYADPEPEGGWALALLALGALGFALSGRSLVMLAPDAGIVLYLSLLYLPLHIEPRYSVPAMPALTALAAVGAWRIAQAAKGCAGLLCPEPAEWVGPSTRGRLRTRRKEAWAL
jgi:4-amino-4-deoxy-L-arabinose transferase-like glycosyltransferase